MTNRHDIPIADTKDDRARSNAMDIDSALESIDRELLDIRNGAIERGAIMLSNIDREMARLQILEDCAKTIKSANDNAVKLLLCGLGEVEQVLRATRIADSIASQFGDMTEWRR